MAKTDGSIERHSFGKIKEVVEMPNLLSVQIDSYQDFLQLGEHVRGPGYRWEYRGHYPILTSCRDRRLYSDQAVCLPDSSGLIGDESGNV